jgi:RimJ/RimL family protein N-acetyltransferase
MFAQLSRPAPLELLTSRLRLSRVCESDIDALWHHWRDPEVARYLWDGREVSRADAEAVVRTALADAARGITFWTLSPAHEQRCIGCAGLRLVAGEVELLYSLDPPAWGCGYAVEASVRVLHYAFEELLLPRVFAGTDPPNLRSLATIERLEFEPYSPPLLEGAVYFVLARERFLALRGTIGRRSLTPAAPQRGEGSPRRG